MKRFVLMHVGFETPTQAIMDAWGHWFASIEDRLVENVGPFLAGIEISHSGSRELPVDKEAVTGYSIIEADSLADAKAIAEGCPFISSIRVYEVGAMQAPGRA
jgi:hypothetical protein